ncbi:ribosome biogenesis GTPase YqeH [Sporolactobacillus inulinus]|jgi:ribosome biogenesis GTPase YqeH|uniref:GTPase n=2 Tax=Sporolactobacillus inulinus TaxID=2078 RepID=A0A0U1QQX0_9BACL|nr:ribosome biogenesis GTPase YqeH [Sporolactobacillus inulinus]KLI03225.1 GTPase [Sporolactobacillus inulinus CASD]GEB76219.1 GTP-binding protein [Sporolactobacillus inulinus]
MDELYCAGCGVKIQTEDPQALGYTPKSALQHDPIVCQRCFRLAHYNEVQDVSLTADDFLTMLSKISEHDALVVYLVDLFDSAGSWVPGLQRFVGGNPVLLVGNKSDLFPKSTNPNKLSSWIRRSAREQGLKPVDVRLMSASKNHGLDEVAAAIDHYRNGRDVYVVGATNVGKSTFINHLIQHLGTGDSAITTSRFPGTTLDFIEIPLGDGGNLYDTPGIINDHQAAHFIDPRDLKKIMPVKEIKPKVFQLNERQTLFLGGLGRLDYIGPARRSLIVYASSSLVIHRTKMEQADDLYARQLGHLLTPPSEKVDLPPMERFDFRTDQEECDLVFSGLGWITIKGQGARITAYAPKGIGVSLRSSLIKG